MFECIYYGAIPGVPRGVASWPTMKAKYVIAADRTSSARLATNSRCSRSSGKTLTISRYANCWERYSNALSNSSFLPISLSVICNVRKSNKKFHCDQYVKGDHHRVTHRGLILGSICEKGKECIAYGLNIFRNSQKMFSEWADRTETSVRSV
jgi:hypothetical protein